MEYKDKIIDLSQRIENGMPVYPGDSETNIIQTKKLCTDRYNNFAVNANMHSGTHIDTPMHLINKNKYVSDLPLDFFIGEGCILNVRNEPVIKMKEEYVEKVRENNIVLLYTGYEKYYGTEKYYEGHPCVDIKLCDFLISKNIKMLGMDMPSPDAYPFKIHKMLLENNIYIIENLKNLDQLLKEDNFEIMAFPLKIKADSSITRAAARIIK